MAANTGKKTWTCRQCGAVNTEKYCNTCGAPEGGSMSAMFEAWPADGHRPSLQEVRAKKEKHGPLKQIKIHSYTSGMMMGSAETHSLELKQEAKGLWLIQTDMPVGQPITVAIYRAEESLLTQVRAIADRENLAAWRYLKPDESKRMQIMDYSASGGMTLVFEDTALGASFDMRCEISDEAVSHAGGDAVLKELRDLLRSAIKPEQLLKTEKQKNPYFPEPGGPGVFPGMMPGGPGGLVVAGGSGGPGGAGDNKPGGSGGNGAGTIAADGSWTCPACGASKLRSKFCPECGTRSPANRKPTLRP